MKKLLCILMLAIMFSCTSDDNNLEFETKTKIPFSAFNYKTFDTSGMLIGLTNYLLDNEGRILSYSNDTDSGLYTYTDNLLSKIERFKGDQLTSMRQFNYDSQNLKEILTEYYSLLNTNYVKIQYQYSSTDTIYAKERRSRDGVNYDINISDSKIVLDANNNRTYFENYDYINNSKDAVISEYDSNNNLIKETFYNDFGSGLLESFNNTLSFSNSINSLFEIYKKTYSKRVLMITHNLTGNAVNHVYAKNISPNTINTFVSTFGAGNSFNLEIGIENIIGNNNYSINSSFKTYVNSDLISHLEYNFIE